MKKLRNKEGFTLIEVVVVMAIIAVLAVLVVGAITVARNTSKETTNRANMRTIQAGMEAYYAKEKKYPTIGSSATMSGFSTAASFGSGTNKVDVSINTTASGCSGFTDTTKNHGGGLFYSTDTNYYIYAAKADCVAPTSSANLDKTEGP